LRVREEAETILAHGQDFGELRRDCVSFNVGTRT
jgi:hypothetical protein